SPRRSKSSQPRARYSFFIARSHLHLAVVHVPGFMRLPPTEPKESVKGDGEMTVDRLERGREPEDGHIPAETRLQPADEIAVPQVPERIGIDAHEIRDAAVRAARDIFAREKSRVLFDELDSAVGVIACRGLVPRLEEETLTRPV